MNGKHTVPDNGAHAVFRHGRVIGDLTIRDVTKELALDVEYAGQAKSPWGTVSAGFSATAKISRKDWGLTYNQVLETGGVMVGDAGLIADNFVPPGARDVSGITFNISSDFRFLCDRERSRR